MQMNNREYVGGTDPAIYIGHRIVRRPGGKVTVCKTYHAEYTLDGRQRSKSLATKNKAAAQRAAHALCEQLRNGIEQRPLKKVPVEELKDAYLAALDAKVRAEKTVAKYRFVLNEFARWWNERDGRSAAKITENDFWSYRKWLKENGKSDQTIEDRLITVKQMYKWGAGRGKLLSVNPLAYATVAEPPPTPQPCFTPEQVSAIIANARPHERPVFSLMAYTGMRVGEVAALRWEDVLLDRGEHGFINVRLGGSNGTTKGKRARLLPIHPELRQILDSLPRRHETVFTRPKSRHCPNGDRPLNHRTLLTSIKRLCKKLGFPNAERFKVHTFRHAFASMCARNQVSYKYALNWMGQKSSDILDMYVTQFDNVAEQAIATINYQPQPAAGNSPAERKPASS